MKSIALIAPASGWLERLVRRQTVPSRNSGWARLFRKRGSHAVPMESTEANEVSEGQTTSPGLMQSPMDA